MARHVSTNWHPELAWVARATNLTPQVSVTVDQQDPRGRRAESRSPHPPDAEMFLAGKNVVGLAFSSTGEMVVATHEAVYKLPLGIYGTLL